jgi:hypothetical protein
MADLVFSGSTPQGVLNSDAMPLNYDMKIYKGDFVEVFVTVSDDNNVPIDLTGYTAEASLKLNYTDSSPVDFTCTLTAPTLGQVKIYLASTISSALVPGDYIWDFQIVKPNGDARTYIAGDVKVLNEVTT